MNLSKYFITKTGCIKYRNLKDVKDYKNASAVYLENAKIVHGATNFEVHDNGLLFYRYNTNYITDTTILWDKSWIENNTYELENDNDAILLYELNYANI